MDKKSIGRIEIKKELSRNRKTVYSDVKKISLPAKKFFSKNVSEVSVTLGYTKNIGNFEFFRVDVNVSDFCDSHKKDETFESVRKYSEKYINTILEEFQKEREMIDGF